MPQNKDLKRLVRARMAASGENYTQALVHVRAGEWLDPLPAAWHLTGSRADDYELRGADAEHRGHPLPTPPGPRSPCTSACCCVAAVRWIWPGPASG
jgi:hypothetical protein